MLAPFVSTIRIQNKNYNNLLNLFFFRVARWMEVLPILLPLEILQSENSFIFKKKLEKFDVLQLIEREVAQ